MGNWSKILPNIPIISSSINSSMTQSSQECPVPFPNKKMSSKILQVSRPLRAPAATWRAALVVWRTLGTLGWAALGESLALPGALGVPRRHWGWIPRPRVGPSWRSLREGPGLKKGSKMLQERNQRRHHLKFVIHLEPKNGCRFPKFPMMACEWVANERLVTWRRAQGCSW